MLKTKTMERLMRFFITLLGAGIGAGISALSYPILTRVNPDVFQAPYAMLILYLGLCFLGALLLFLLSGRIIHHTLQFIGAIANRWDRMPISQVLFASTGLVLGLLVAFLSTQLVLSAGPSLLTLSFSALVYLVMGMLGLQIGYRRSKEDGRLARSLRRRFHSDAAAAEDDFFFPEEDGDGSLTSFGGVPPKLLDTSVIIDGRILDIAKTGFLEGKLVIPLFVLAELQHVADSSDSLRRARGRQGLDVLSKLQKELSTVVVINETDYDDITEVDVKLLRLCRDLNGIVVTNDYNLNKVAGVTGLQVLNINDLANAVKPVLMAGEELTVNIVREGKEPGQGVSYLDDGTMIVVENGRRYVGEHVPVVVTTVLQTSAGRMIFTKMKNAEDRAN